MEKMDGAADIKVREGGREGERERERKGKGGGEAIRLCPFRQNLSGSNWLWSN